MRSLLPWLRLIFRRPGRLVTGGLLMLITLVSGVGLLALSGWFITETALVGALLAAGVAASINLYVPGGGIRLFAVTRTVARYLERVYNHDTVLRLLTDIRVALFRQLANTHRASQNRLTSAQWLSRLTTDVDALDTLYLRFVAPSGLALVVSLLMVAAAWLLWDGATAAGVLVGLVLTFLTVTMTVYWRTRKLACHQGNRTEALRTAVVEHLDGFPELTAAGRIQDHADRLIRQSEQLTADQARIECRVGWHQALGQLAVNLIAVAALWAGYGLYQTEQISGPVLVLLPIALLGLAEAFAMLPEAYGRLGATVSAAARLSADVSNTRPPAPICRLPDSGDLAVDARDLAVRHEGAPPLLSHFDLQVTVGERIGIVGHSGSGKSSLADTLAGLLPPAHGSLACQPMAYLTQRTVIFDDTLRANLLLGNPEAGDDQLWRVLQLVELDDRFANEPDRLDTWLGSTGSRLSGGEARRVALARVLLSQAPVLVLDEPFTGVDSATRDRIKSRLNRWLEGKTVIVLAHGPDALTDTDRVIHL